MSKMDLVRRILREHPEMTTRQQALLAGLPAQEFWGLRWRVRNPEKVRERARLYEERQRRAAGIKPLRNEHSSTIVALVRDGKTYSEAAAIIGTTREAVAGVVYRAKRDGLFDHQAGA